MEKKIKASIYDFDKTLYRGDSLIDFWIYMLIRRPYTLLLLPLQFFFGILFILKLVRLARFKALFLLFTTGLKTELLDYYLKDFWKRKRKKIFPWVRERLAEERKRGEFLICNSASPRFILEPMVSELGFDLLICTEFEARDGRQTNRMIGTNCRGEEKVRRLEKWSAENDIELSVTSAYSDHLSDVPLLELAEHGYLIVHGKIEPYTPTNRRSN
ncbi:MAG: hypothetical protein A2Y33_13135 [Spirochaetes bacterium GWF1_51_8]|nr:MAG: hypothetical protein A2Y33_13135 [Spirochaetes bacterium GWF1_51_8]